MFVMIIAQHGSPVNRNTEILLTVYQKYYGPDAAYRAHSGAEPICVPLMPPVFPFGADVPEAAFRQHPKALILRSPSNPCGTDICIEYNNTPAKSCLTGVSVVHAWIVGYIRLQTGIYI